MEMIAFHEAAAGHRREPMASQLRLDTASFVPYYEQIVEQIREQVRSQRLVAGAEFCSEGELARALGISKMPIRQAFQKLRDEGLLVIRRGKKPVIGKARVSWDFQRLRGFSEEMMRRGLKPTARTLSLDQTIADGGVLAALQLKAHQKVYRLKRLQFIDAEPVAVVSSYLPCHLFPGLDAVAFGSQSLYHVIENLYGRPLQRADEVIGATKAKSAEARILKTSVGSALLTIRETTYGMDQQPLEHSFSLLRADRYTATVTAVRRPPAS